MEENEIKILKSLDRIENYGKKLIIPYSYFDKKKEMETTIDDKYKNLLKKTIENYNREPIDKILGIKLDNNIIYSHSIEDIEINKDNIHLYYEFMSDEDIIKNQDLISDVLCDRFFEIKKNIEFDSHPFKHYNVQLRKNSEASGEPLKMDFFGIKDTLKPINEYISEIKESEQYKTYIKKLDSKEDALNKIVANYEEVIEEDTLNNESRELSQDQNEDSLSNGEEKRIANFNVKTDEESEQKSKVRKNR